METAFPDTGARASIATTCGFPSVEISAFRAVETNWPSFSNPSASRHLVTFALIEEAENICMTVSGLTEVVDISSGRNLL